MWSKPLEAGNTGADPRVLVRRTTKTLGSPAPLAAPEQPSPSEEQGAGVERLTVSGGQDWRLTLNAPPLGVSGTMPDTGYRSGRREEAAIRLGADLPGRTALNDPVATLAIHPPLQGREEEATL